MRISEKKNAWILLEKPGDFEKFAYLIEVAVPFFYISLLLSEWLLFIFKMLTSTWNCCGVALSHAFSKPEYQIELHISRYLNFLVKNRKIDCFAARKYQKKLGNTQAQGHKCIDVIRFKSRCNDVTIIKKMLALSPWFYQKCQNCNQ